MRAKNLLQSKTFWGAALTFTVAATPKVTAIIDGAIAGQPTSASAIGEVIVLTATTLLTVVGRVQASQTVYTPEFLPGPNKRDLQ